VNAGELANYFDCFFFCQHDRQSPGLFGANGVNGQVEFLAQNFAIQK
jgi:hypothetical protein